MLSHVRPPSQSVSELQKPVTKFECVKDIDKSDDRKSRHAGSTEMAIQTTQKVGAKTQQAPVSSLTSISTSNFKSMSGERLE